MALKLLFASSEVFPLAKTGGLADVAASLPAAVAGLGLDVRVLMPAYPGSLGQLSAPQQRTQMTVRGQAFTLWEGRHPHSGVPVWLLDCPALYGRAGDAYHNAAGQPFPDNAWRFGCFCEAGVRLALGEAGWKADAVHANDWQAGLIPALLSRQPQRPRTVFTIHNLAYQGQFGRGDFDALGLPAELWSPTGLEFHGAGSFMKGGIVFADRITTVSPTYATEIQTPIYGFGLDGALRTRAAALSGILNGIDEQVWNPRSDPHLSLNYGPADVTAGKRANKRALQKELGLHADAVAAVVGMVGRLAQQKGTDAVLAAGAELMKRPVQLAVLAGGDRGMEDAFRALARAYPGRVGVKIGHHEALAHRIEAGADFFLMPSRYEPCGLNQMYSQRYGTIPLVRRTGGLADSVTDASDATLKAGTATGVCFENADAGGVLYAVDRALALWHDPKTRQAIQAAGMARDFSWARAAGDYVKLYRG